MVTFCPSPKLSLPLPMVVASPNTVAALPSLALTSPVLAGLPSPCCSTPPSSTSPVLTGESTSLLSSMLTLSSPWVDVAVVDVDLLLDLAADDLLVEGVVLDVVRDVVDGRELLEVVTSWVRYSW